MPDFKFDSINAFLTMSGHGSYVWSCVVLAVVMLGALLIHPVWSHRRSLSRLARQLERSEQQAFRHRHSKSTP